MGIFGDKVKKHQVIVYNQCLSMLNEDERVYRNQVDYFSQNFGPARVTPMGLAKARLFGSAFPGSAFAFRWSAKRLEQAVETMNACMVFAVKDLLEPNGPITHDSRCTTDGEVYTCTPGCNIAALHPFFLRVCKLIRDEFKNGPSTTPPDEKLTAGFLGLLELSREALKESVVESSHYAGEANEHFDRYFKGAIFGRMSVLSDLLKTLGGLR